MTAEAANERSGALLIPFPAGCWARAAAWGTGPRDSPGDNLGNARAGAQPWAGLRGGAGGRGRRVEAPVHTRKLAGTLPERLLERDALVLSIHDALYAGAAICVLGILASLASERRRTAPAKPGGALPPPATATRGAERTEAP